jgi:hypothetical protein
MNEKLNINRPEVGYLSKVRLHDSNRSKPLTKPKDYPTLSDVPLSDNLSSNVDDTIRKTKGGRLF